MAQLLTIAAATTTLAGTADAQDLVVMRRVIAPARPHVQSPPAGHWVRGNVLSNGPACSARAPATQLVTCRGKEGELLPDNSCQEAKPDTAVAVEDYRACTYLPVVGDYTDWSATCGSATSARDNTCLRRPGDQPVDPQTYCGIPRHEERSGYITSGCTGTWRIMFASCVGGRQQPVVTCVDTDGSPSASCDATSKPSPAAAQCDFQDGFETPGAWGRGGAIQVSDAPEGRMVYPMSGTGITDLQSTSFSKATVGTRNVVSLLARSIDGKPNTLRIMVHDSTAWIVDTPVTVGATGWTRFEASWNAKTAKALLRLVVTPSAKGIQVDDVAISHQ